MQLMPCAALARHVIFATGVYYIFWFPEVSMETVSRHGHYSLKKGMMDEGYVPALLYGYRALEDSKGEKLGSLEMPN